MSSWEAFVQTLPIIGSCLVGIFGTIGVMIVIVYLLNKVSNSLASRKSKDEDQG